MTGVYMTAMRHGLVPRPPSLPASVAAGAQAAEVKKLAIMVPEQGTDYGWNQQGVDAAKAVAEKYGLEFMPAEGLGYGDVRPTLRELADDGASLIIAHASGYNTAAPEIGAEKKVPVAIVDNPDAQKAGLVADYTLSGHEGAYLAGRLAAKTTKTGASASSCPASRRPGTRSRPPSPRASKAENPQHQDRLCRHRPGRLFRRRRRQARDRTGDRRRRRRRLRPGRRLQLRHDPGGRDHQGHRGGKVWFIDVIGDKTSIDKGHLLSSVLWNMVPVYQRHGRGPEGRQVRHPQLLDQLADNSVAAAQDQAHPRRRLGLAQDVRQQIIDGKIKVEPVSPTRKPCAP